MTIPGGKFYHDCPFTGDEVVCPGQTPWEWWTVIWTWIAWLWSLYCFFFSIKLSIFVLPVSWACGVVSPVGLGILFWTSQALGWRDAGCSLQADSGRSLPPRLSPRWEGGVQEDPHRQLPVQVLPGSVTDFEGDGKWNWPHVHFPRPGGLWECPKQERQQLLPKSYRIE